MRCDVAIIGGGPGGSTTACLLKKYDPSLNVVVLEREKFPREHIGESQLPLIGRILREMGVWETVEAAGFPIKVGTTQRWGKKKELWDFNFIPEGKLIQQERPGKFEGQRTNTAFQVERSIYDKILLDRALELGADVREETAVRQVEHDAERVTGLTLSDGTALEADFYVDASGHVGILRRTLGVGIDEPSHLKNIAIWDYWRNAEWAVTIGNGGTRVFIMSLDFGWLWFIPLGPDRTSCGLVCPAEYYKQCGLTPEELYMKAVSSEPLISDLVKNASRENRLATTKDWSFVANRGFGENWALVGEALGFADPILAAGMTLTHACARECAYSILEERRGGDRDWIWSNYERKNVRRIRQHIQFADYWYTANSNFTELKEFTREIARDAGLELDGENAFQWLGQGGFVEEDMGVGGIGLVDIRLLHQITGRMSEREAVPAVNGLNHFELLIDDAEAEENARYEDGTVIPTPMLRKGARALPLNGMFGMIVESLKKSPRADDLECFIETKFHKIGRRLTPNLRQSFIGSIEAMIRDGWLIGKLEGDSAPLSLNLADETLISNNREQEERTTRILANS